MNQTTNLRLNYITDADDMAVRDFFMSLAGSGTNSNMQILDREIQTLKNAQPNQMIGATSSKGGEAGIAPAPSAGKEASFLRGDATWADPMEGYDPDGAVKTAGGITAYVDNKVDSKTEVFWINLTQSGSTYACNKTFAEISQADDEGKLCVAKFDSTNTRLHLMWKSSTELFFARIVGAYIYQFAIRSSNACEYKQIYPETLASNVKSGKFPGAIYAGVQTSATSLLRNSRILSAAEAESATLTEGEIIWVYE